MNLINFNNVRGYIDDKGMAHLNLEEMTKEMTYAKTLRTLATTIEELENTQERVKKLEARILQLTTVVRY